MVGSSKFGAAKPSAPAPTIEGLIQSMVAAILKNDARGINNLISQGAPVNASDAKGNSLLTIASTDPREHGKQREEMFKTRFSSKTAMGSKELETTLNQWADDRAVGKRDGTAGIAG